MGLRTMADADARMLQTALREQLDHDQIVVRVYGSHLVIDVITPSGALPVPRLTQLGRDRYGLGFRRHTGKWCPLPYSGTLREMAQTTVEQLGGHLDPRNYAWL